MANPKDWLLYPITLAEVEADLAELGAPDLWLKKWRVLLEQMAPGDELWEYQVMEDTGDWIPECSGDSGFALVRGDEVIDWIGAPPSVV